MCDHDLRTGRSYPGGISCVEGGSGQVRGGLRAECAYVGAIPCVGGAFRGRSYPGDISCVEGGSGQVRGGLRAERAYVGVITCVEGDLRAGQEYLRASLWAGGAFRERAYLIAISCLKVGSGQVRGGLRAGRSYLFDISCVEGDLGAGQEYLRASLWAGGAFRERAYLGAITRVERALRASTPRRNRWLRVAPGRAAPKGKTI